MSDHSPHANELEAGFAGFHGNSQHDDSPDNSAFLVKGGGYIPAAVMQRQEFVIPAHVGSQLWYRPSNSDLTGPLPMAVQAGDAPGEGCKPLHATVLAVWEGGAVVNLQVLDVLGHAFTKKRVTLRQQHQPRPAGGFCEWPSYGIPAGSFR